MRLLAGDTTQRPLKIIEEVTSVALTDCHGSRSGSSTEDLGSPVFEGAAKRYCIVVTIARD